MGEYERFCRTWAHAPQEREEALQEFGFSERNRSMYDGILYLGQIEGSEFPVQVLRDHAGGLWRVAPEVEDAHQAVLWLWRQQDNRPAGEMTKGEEKELFERGRRLREFETQMESDLVDGLGSA